MTIKNQQTAINDSLSSLTMVLGQRQNALKYQADLPLTNDAGQLEILWSQNWIAQKICSKKSRDMVRRWREISSNDLNADQLEKIEAVERKIKLKETMEKALVWASLYGGVGVLVLTNGSPISPLNSNQTVERLVLINKRLIHGKGTKNDNVLSVNFGKYDYYCIDGKVDVHHSRLIILNAVDLPLSQNELFGLSDLEPLYRTLKRFDVLTETVGELVTESKVDVFKMANLTETLDAGRENEIAKSMASVQMIKSVTNSLLIDGDNEYEQKELTFTGLKDLLVEFRNAVAGAADMPVTILFGQSVSGLASGDEDIQNYHESIHALQESRLRPVFERLDPLISTMAIGYFPQDWWFEFPTLRELNTEQRLNALNVFASATGVLIDKGVLLEHQVTNELKESGLFSNISAEDVDEIERFNNADQPTEDLDPTAEGEDTEEPSLPTEQDE